jgi:diacylglycerol kinase family enzyme
VFKGTHVNEPNFTVLRGRAVTFTADRPFTAYADGDPIVDLPATVRVLPGALRVLVP